MELPFFAGNALNDETGVFIYENAHFTP
jgi:hypothetical protein